MDRPDPFARLGVAAEVGRYGALARTPGRAGGAAALALAQNLPPELPERGRHAPRAARTG